MRIICMLACWLTLSTLMVAQAPAKKMLDHADFDLWKSISKPQLSADGRWTAYELTVLDGDAELVLYDGNSGKETRFPRGQEAGISADSRYLVFKLKPAADSIKAQKRRKVKKEDLTKDTLAIYDLSQAKLEKIAEVKAYYLPQHWSGWLAWQHEPMAAAEQKTDSVKTEKKKKENADNGSRLVIRHLAEGYEKTMPYVTAVTMAKKQPVFLLASTGLDSSFSAGVYRFDGSSRSTTQVLAQAGKYRQLCLDEQGEQAAFLVDRDTTKARVRPWELFYYRSGQEAAALAVASGAEFMPANWLLSEHGNLRFSGKGERLFFGIAPPPILPDTTLLEEEIVQVEVWRYDEPRLHTQQKVLLEQEKKRHYQCVYYPGEQRVVQLTDTAMPEIRMSRGEDARAALGFDERPYLMETSWTGGPACRDVYVVDVHDGTRELVQRGLCAVPQLSPDARYLIWYMRADAAWYSYALADKKLHRIAGKELTAFYDELDDTPALPSAYGIATWGSDDAFVLLYDRYDLWKADPSGMQMTQRITEGRKSLKTYRYINTDEEKQAVAATETILLHQVDERSRNEGYAWLDLNSWQLRPLSTGAYAYSRRPIKARQADKWLFTRENFQVFPDLHYSADLISARQISQANPQQKDYRWGSVELVRWTSADGQPLEGMLVKPEGFDPAKKYPMIVNFYERSSDGLHRYAVPAPGRSSIGYSFYASRGYLIFNPDVPYREGYPGESAFNAVVSGTAALIDKGFVDKTRIGLQGHSWGGYQGAYIITRTDMFRCAEIGAPVVNMISAYGGIRWESGLVRQFQYEQAQSRIAGSPWTHPLRYLENSPIFTMDKVNTPVLILHNDKDGAVPWYQGIEMFTALRRMNKPAWMLNYNDEPHWPVKLQNRKDFQRRMQQFFDHYLMDAPLPPWMERGVPAIEKGIRQGLDE